MCQLSQPALRDDDAWSIAATRLVHYTTAGYDELNPFSASIGAPPFAAQLILSCDGIRTTVSIHLDSGRAVGLDLSAHTGGLPAIVLKPETDVEVYAKERGYSREVQVGDAAFDAAVYIESD